jgi:RNA polymerase sigma-70 factor (ECF subfamily)
MAVSDATPLEASSRRSLESRELVDRVRSGDLEAFEEIIRLHERRILGMAVQMGLSPADAQDACQEVFLRVFRYLGSFRAGQRFEAWLWRIAVNVVYDSLRARRDREEVSWEVVFQGGEGLVSRSGGLQITIENADLCAKVLSRMEVLSPQERMVFVLKELQELDTAEVARAMRISSITVRRHLASGRRKLREVLRGLDTGKGEISPGG